MNYQIRLILIIAFLLGGEAQEKGWQNEMSPRIYINAGNTYEYHNNDVGSLTMRNRIVKNIMGITIQEQAFYENGTGYQRPDRRAHHLDDKNGGL
jgi:hypothetical protein